MYIFQMIDGLTTGGAEQLQVTFAQEAKKRGFNLAVISLDDPGDSQYLKQLHELNVKVHCFPTHRVFDKSNLLGILDLLRREHPDVLHTHLTYSYIIGSMTARLAGIPVVATLHSTGVDPQLVGTRTAWAEKFALRYLVRDIIACGPAVAAHYKMTIKDKPVHVIPNAVGVFDHQIPFTDREVLRRQIAGDSSRFIIISVGRLVPQKGFEDLINAFSILRSSHPEAFLVIAGSGPSRGAIEQKIKDLHLSNDVNLLGWRPDVHALLAVSDMFVLASHWEGLPVSILEAMSAALPVLATDVSDNAWTLGETGVIVPPCQPVMFADAMAKLVGNPARCKVLGKNAQMRIKENFDPSDWFDKIISVYQSLS